MASIQQIQGYEVLDNGNPAIFPNSSEWKKYFYTDYQDALAYCKAWLGSYAEYLPENWQGESHDYNGYGDTIEIRFIPGIEL